MHQFGEWEEDENQKTIHNVKFIDNIQIGDKSPGIGFEQRNPLCPISGRHVFFHRGLRGKVGAPKPQRYLQQQ
ncbi:hypothetical protein SDC9_145176 [bioreactor metagenome]|uniref:Uncharacterized protein n=1 Tax=bioreactor metagenome TaxID=1076179 RepID=A0A645E948_9ZZZZ